ncbi:MAG: hypothetical protein AAGI23_22240 [Bacteroidota bacterium]
MSIIIVKVLSYPVRLFWEYFLMDEITRNRYLLNVSIGTMIPLTDGGIAPVGFLLLEPQYRINDYYTLGLGVKATMGLQDQFSDSHYRVDVKNLPYLGRDPNRVNDQDAVFILSNFNKLLSFYSVLERTFWKGKFGTFLGVGGGYFRSLVSNDVNEAIGYTDAGSTIQHRLVYSNDNRDYYLTQGAIIHFRIGYSYSHFKTALHFNITTNETPEFFTLLFGYDIGGGFKR